MQKKKKSKWRNIGFEFWTLLHYALEEGSFDTESEAGVQSILHLRVMTFKLHTRFHYTLERSGLEYIYGHIDLIENVLMIKSKYLMFWK